MFSKVVYLLIITLLYAEPSKVSNPKKIQKVSVRKQITQNVTSHQNSSTPSGILPTSGNLNRTSTSFPSTSIPVFPTSTSSDPNLSNTTSSELSTTDSGFSTTFRNSTSHQNGRTSSGKVTPNPVQTSSPDSRMTTSEFPTSTSSENSSTSASLLSTPPDSTSSHGSAGSSTSSDSSTVNPTSPISPHQNPAGGGGSSIPIQNGTLGMNSSSSTENPSSTTVDSSTSSNSNIPTSESPTTSIPNPKKFRPPQKQTNSDVHCFIDDKLRSEVELFHVIGIRKVDNKISISAPGEHFNFSFFEKKPTATTTTSSESTIPSSTSNSPRSTITQVSASTVTPISSIATYSVSTSDFSTSSSSPLTSEHPTSSASTSAIPTSSFSPSTLSSSPTSSDSTSSITPGSTYSTTSPDSTTTSDLDSTTSENYLSSTEISSTTDLPSSIPAQNFNTPMNVTLIDGTTVAWDEGLGRFHFLTPDKAFRHYQIDYKRYVARASTEENTALFSSFGRPITRSRNLTSPYTCHYNVKNNYSACIAISGQLVTVGIYRNNDNSVKENRFSLPKYLSFDSFFSYSDSKGTDYILIHHRGQWIYRINYQMYLMDQSMFFKVFHLRTPDGLFQFSDFEHADEYGLVTRYSNEYGEYRYYYSLFSEVSGLTTYCVYNKFINGRLMILGRERPEEKKTVAEALRQMINVEKRDVLEVPPMLKVLFYCTLIYLSIFLGTQMITGRKIFISRDLRHTDREIQRLAPVIETIMSKVYEFLEKAKVRKTD